MELRSALEGEMEIENGFVICYLINSRCEYNYYAGKTNAAWEDSYDSECEYTDFEICDYEMTVLNEDGDEVEPTPEQEAMFEEKVKNLDVNCFNWD